MYCVRVVLLLFVFSWFVVTFDEVQCLEEREYGKDQSFFSFHDLIKIVIGHVGGE